MLKNSFKDLKDILEKKYELGLDNPITIIFLGHLILFLLAIPYYNEFGMNSLLKMGFFVALNILAFSIPFFINFENVITSYSIHYTKLYEHLKRLKKL